MHTKVSVHRKRKQACMSVRLNILCLVCIHVHYVLNLTKFYRVLSEPGGSVGVPCLRPVMQPISF